MVLKHTRREILAGLALPALTKAAPAAMVESRPFERYAAVWSALASGRTMARSEIEALVDNPDDLRENGLDLGHFSAAIPHVDVLYDAIALQIASVLDPSAAGLPALEDRGQVFAWSWSYTARAAIILWKATGQERFRTLFVDSARRIMALRDDRTGRRDEVQGRVVRSWGAPWPVHGETKRITDVTVTGLVSLPILTFANELARNDPLADEFSAYGHDLLQGFWEFDRYFAVLYGGRSGYYRSWLEPETFEAQNHVHALAAAGAEMYRLTHDRDLLTRVEMLWNGFKRGITLDDKGAAFWAYIPEPFSTQKVAPEAFWKAAVTLEFPLACRNAGILVSDQDMKAFARTYSENVLLSDETYNILIGLRDPGSTYRWDAPLAKPEFESLMPFIYRGLWFSGFEPSLTPRLTGLLRHHPLKFPDGLLRAPFGLLTRARLWPNAS
jgi:hypothetical protein